MAYTTEDPSPATVRFARRSSRGMILGLSGLQVACIAAAASVALPALFTAGGTGLLVTSCVWVTLLAVAFAPWARPACRPDACRPRVTSWYDGPPGRRRTGPDPASHDPAGTLALPGDCRVPPVPRGRRHGRGDGARPAPADAHRGCTGEPPGVRLAVPGRSGPPGARLGTRARRAGSLGTLCARPGSRVLPSRQRPRHHRVVGRARLLRQQPVGGAAVRRADGDHGTRSLHSSHPHRPVPGPAQERASHPNQRARHFAARRRSWVRRWRTSRPSLRAAELKARRLARAPTSSRPCSAAPTTPRRPRSWTASGSRA